MADNYLEKRMQDYSSGRLSPKSTAKARSGLRCIRIPSLGVFVVDATSADSLMLKALVEIGYRVCFTAQADGPAIAQATGARFYPIPYDAIAADLAARGEALHAVILPADTPSPIPSVTSVVLTSTTPTARALEAVYRCCGE